MYDERFYDTVRPGAQASAAAVVPLVMAELERPTAVVDVGCGEGWWLKTFADQGCDVTGLDGDRPPRWPLAHDRFIAHDLRQPLPNLGRHDLTVSLEVAEHLPADRATSFVADLCRLAPLVLFSAAIPGQGGTGHVNEQWPGYWVERFSASGYACSGALRWLIWDDERVENWYRQNLMVAAAKPSLYPQLFDVPTAPMWPVVHPVLYDARRQH